MNEQKSIAPLEHVAPVESVNDDSLKIWEPTAIRKQRRIYLLLLLCIIVMNVIYGITGFAGATLLVLLLDIGLLYYFLEVVRRVLSYSIVPCILIAVATFIPLVGIIVLAVIDRKVYDALKYDGKDEAEPDSNNIPPPVSTNQNEKSLLSKHMIATILFVAFVSLILTVILDLYIKKKTQEAVNTFSEIQPGMTKDEVIIHLSKIPGVDTQLLSQNKNTIWIPWPYTWRPVGRLIMEYKGDKIEDIRFTNGMHLLQWDNITRHAEFFAGSYILVIIDYIFILGIIESILFISVRIGDYVLRVRRIPENPYRVILVLFVLFYFISGFTIPSRVAAVISMLLS